MLFIILQNQHIGRKNQSPRNRCISETLQYKVVSHKSWFTEYDKQSTCLHCVCIFSISYYKYYLSLIMCKLTSNYFITSLLECVLICTTCASYFVLYCVYIWKRFFQYYMFVPPYFNDVMFKKMQTHPCYEYTVVKIQHSQAAKANAEFIYACVN